MAPDQPDWTLLIARSLLHQLGRAPTREDLERLMAELRAARQDPEGAGIGRELRALGLGELAGPGGGELIRQVIDHTLTQLTALVGDPQADATPAVADAAVLAADAARALLTPFVRPGVPGPLLTAALRPRAEDYGLAFEPAWAGVARQAYERLWEAGMPAIAPRRGQTELLLAVASVEQLRAQPPRAFPGGAARVAHMLLPGRQWVCWKFVRPGQTLGLAFDGLCWLDGRFAWFPRAWRLLGRIDA
jgi:hypothetical protein